MVGEAYPRMLKWETGVHVIGPQLEDEVFKFLEFVATNEEKNEVYTLGLFHKKQAVNECGASSSRPAPGEKRQVEDQNPKGKGVDFDKSNNENIGHGGTDFEVQFEDDVGSRAKDVEVGWEDVDADDDYILVDDITPDIPMKA
ncbi:Uncharacterized protein Fot_06771 [Forsythia ovata]|uniref:Uncharacterized protein n=1 Tax=Forsythia ovata TaxID=205694 RepID=A0ABD1WTX1_9LAMI